jgi:hypothetical protein
MNPNSPQSEHQHHAYVTNRIPWWVRLVWVGFWVFAVYYTIVYMLPAMVHELAFPPAVVK